MCNTTANVGQRASASQAACRVGLAKRGFAITSMDCTRHDFIRDSAAFFVAAGLGGFAFGGDPAQAQLRVGILSDIHIALKDSDRSAYIGIDMFEFE